MRRLIPALVATYALLLMAMVGWRTPVSAMGGALAALCAAGLLGGLGMYVRRWRWPTAAAMGFLGLLVTLGLAMLGARAMFIIREGGLDRAEHPGSPVAFLLGLAAEQCLLTIPAGLLLLSLGWARRQVTGEA
ncbi:MAG: hypothetical protein AB7N24_23860 [Dehalococcoidia bacterium]